MNDMIVIRNRAWYLKCKPCKQPLPQNKEAQREYLKNGKQCPNCISKILIGSEQRIATVKKLSDPNNDIVLKRLIQTRHELARKEYHTPESESGLLRERIQEVEAAIYTRRQERLKEALGK